MSYEAIYKKKLDLNDLHIFRCKALIIEFQHYKKLKMKTHTCVYLKPSKDSPAHKLFNPFTKRYLNSWNVTFFKKEFSYKATTATEMKNEITTKMNQIKIEKQEDTNQQDGGNQSKEKPISSPNNYNLEDKK
jgi:hypothetical protein